MAFIEPTPPTPNTVIGRFDNPQDLDIFQTWDKKGNLIASMNYLGVMNVPASPVSIAPIISLTTITTAQLESLSTIPIELVPAPGPGKLIFPQYYSIQLDFGGTPFSISNGGAGNTFIYWSGLGLGADDVYASGVMPDNTTNGGMDYTSSESQFFAGGSGLGPSGPVSSIINSSLVMTMDDVLSGGNGSMLVTVSYAIAPASV
jgi:hypothetical protein